MSIEDARQREVFIVDDDPDVCRLLAIAFPQAGFRVATFTDGHSAVGMARTRTPACILVDLYLPGGSGLDVLDQLDANNYAAPIVMISGRGDIAIAVEAIKRGAFDFVEKHRGVEAIVARARAAMNAGPSRRRHGGTAETAPPEFAGYALLTPREQEVLNQIVACASNKEAAAKLGISRRTVEIHRGHIMKKLGAKNSVDLVRMVLGGGQGAIAQRRSA
jgi:FixJ family two-component response regulator